MATGYGTSWTHVIHHRHGEGIAFDLFHAKHVFEAELGSAVVDKWCNYASMMCMDNHVQIG